MTTVIYTKDGNPKYIMSENVYIGIDPKNRDYRKIMAQDAISPFERVEIVEYPWEAIRVRRNSLLLNCDWTRIDDVVLTTETKNLWRDYRKALRDIPQDYEDPDKIVWPIPPA